MKLLIASHNKHKIIEIKEILKDLPLEILSGDDIEHLPEVIENKDTIEGNAIKKAVEVAQKTGFFTVADDTGLFVNALDGRPGVYAARYAGENCTYEDNRKKMLKEMTGKTDRSASFQTVVAFASTKGLIGTAKGEVLGKITEMDIGDKGFGYDPIFRADETGLTFGEMSDIEKHKISHRGRAFRNLIPIINDFLGKNK